MREALAAREAGVGQKFASLPRIECQSRRGLVPGHPIGHKMIGRFFPALGQLVHNPLLVGGQGKSFAHARIVERFAGDVEAIEVSAQVIERMKIRTLH